MGKSEVIQILGNSDGYVSGESISKELGTSRAAVWKTIKNLQNDGYVIDSVTNRGYRLVECPDTFSEAEIARRLPLWYDVNGLHFAQTVDSTNTRLKELESGACPDLSVYVADCQTGGKGRLGRSFYSPSGCGIYISMLLRPRAALSALGTITAYAAVAVCEAIEAVTGLKPGIKWVNDLVIDGKKVCGILTEMSVEAESNHADCVIIGCGINANLPDGGYPEEIARVAGALSQFTGKSVNRSALAAEIIIRLAEMGRIFPDGCAGYTERYRERCITLGKDIRVTFGSGSYTAKALGLSDDCGLIAELPDGSRTTITYGEVSVRGLYGYSD